MGIDTDDVATQEALSHHDTREDDGSFRYLPHRYRYVRAAELDLMARLAGMTRAPERGLARPGLNRLTRPGLPRWLPTGASWA